MKILGKKLQIHENTNNIDMQYVVSNKPQVFHLHSSLGYIVLLGTVNIHYIHSYCLTKNYSF